MELQFKTIKIRVSFFFAVVLCAVSVFDKSNIILINLLSALFHETGHVIAMIVLGEKPELICFTPFGMKIERKEMNKMNFKNEALIAVAGPATNFVLAGASFAAIKIFSLKMSAFCIINIVLGLLNLAVCEPLDGYRVARYILLQKTSEERTEKILKVSSLAFLLPIATAGFYVLIKSGYNFSLILVAAYLCAFLIVGTKSI